MVALRGGATSHAAVVAKGLRLPMIAGLRDAVLDSASRDDTEVGFLGSYVRDQVIAANPFECLDCEGVGRILRICIDEARGRRPDLPIGLCGEHAGDPASVEYLVSLGLGYLSCSPRQVPLARFSAGRATLMRSTLSSD